MSVELKSIPLVVQPSNRGVDTGTDAKLINAVVERQPDDSVHVFRRPVVDYISSLTYSGGTEPKLVGYMPLQNLSLSYVAVHHTSPFGTYLYRLDDVAAPVPLGALGVAMLTSWEMIYVPSGQPKIFLTAKGIGNVYNTVTNTISTVASYSPSADGDRIGPMVYLDGLVFLLTEKGNIWNCNINDPDVWAPLNFIRASTDDDVAMAIQLQLTYIVAFKRTSISVFYNAARPQGSPLAPNDSAKNNEVGLANTDTLVRINDTLIWLSATKSGKVSVCMMQRLQVTEVASNNISRILRNVPIYTSYIKAFGIQSGGHDFYVLLIDKGVDGTTVLCYDLTSGAWSDWTWPFEILDNAFYIDSSYWYNNPVILQRSTTEIHEFTSTKYADNLSSGTSTCRVDIYTPLWDQQVRLKKQNIKLEIHGDQKSAGTVQVCTTDDDYQTWGPVRDVSLSDGVATSVNWGTFRRRGWHISNDENVPFRVTNLIAHISLGSS